MEQNELPNNPQLDLVNKIVEEKNSCEIRFSKHLL